MGWECFFVDLPDLSNNVMLNFVMTFNSTTVIQRSIQRIFECPCCVDFDILDIPQSNCRVLEQNSTSLVTTRFIYHAWILSNFHTSPFFNCSLSSFTSSEIQVLPYFVPFYVQQNLVNHSSLHLVICAANKNIGGPAATCFCNIEWSYDPTRNIGIWYFSGLRATGFFPRIIVNWVIVPSSGSSPSQPTYTSC